MSTKGKISANGTYVFDPEEIEQLDELSLTSMIAAIVPNEQPDEARRVDLERGACAGDTTINALLEEPVASPEDPLPTYVDPRGDPEEAGDLIAPELMFTEPPSRRR
jgi:hypothetical protein